MKISAKFKISKENKKPLVSFEMFPPKKEEAFKCVGDVIQGLCDLDPGFISVTCGAGGGSNRNRTIELAQKIKNEFSIDSMAHMTCITLNERSVVTETKAVEEAGIENVLALRGDIPKENYNADDVVYRYAYELIEKIKKNSDICIGAGAYPEGHIECSDFDESVRHLKIKEDMGAEFFVSQLFFDNKYYYNLCEKAAKLGIKAPITPGVMPMMSKGQISNMIFMCGASLPSEMIKILYRYENDPTSLLKAGVEYAGRQIADLVKNGAPGVHIYSMNKPELAKQLAEYVL